MTQDPPDGLVWRMVRAVAPTLERPLQRRLSRQCSENWRYRTWVAMQSPDNAFIPRVANAGNIEGDFQVMHNGLRVARGSYYGPGPEYMFRKNKGVHEPQEERAFQEVLKVIPDGGVMVELGAYWAFYSMWFCQRVPSARVHMVEPAEANLRFGQQNFHANGFRGHFTRALVGAAPSAEGATERMVCVDELMAEHNLSHIDLLHSDIQGFELDMLHGAKRALSERRITWFFISTHSDELHAQCEAHLAGTGNVTVASVPPSESYAVDGILVARAADAPDIGTLALSRRKARGRIF